MLQIRLQHLPVRSQCYEKGRHEMLIMEGGGVTGHFGHYKFRPYFLAETSLKLFRPQNMDVSAKIYRVLVIR